MLSLETEHRLARLLFQLAECERSVERSRQDLCSNPNFDAYSIFRLIDSRTNGKLEVMDLKAFLSRSGISVLRSNLQLLIKQYDSNYDDKLSLEEFQALVLPAEDLVLRREVLSRNIFPVTPYIESAVARHLELETSYQSQLETLKKSLASRLDFNPIDAFRAVDVDRLNLINSYEIRDFLRRNGYSIGLQDLDAIIRRIDVDCDSRLCYDEFAQGILHSGKDRPRSATRKRQDSPLRKSTTKSSSNKSSPNKSTYSSPTKSPARSPSKKLNRSVRSRLFEPVPAADMRSIIQLFFSQISLDRDIERQRIILSKRPDFNILDFFRLFDLNDLTRVTSSDIEGLLHDLRVPFSVDEVYLLIRRNSSYKDSVLRFSDFERMFIPRDKLYADLVRERRGRTVPAYDRLRVFSDETVEEMARTVKLMMQCEVAAEELRRRISAKKWINFYEVFEDIDRDRDGMIGIGEFQDVFRRHGEYPSIEELEALVERYDRDFDRRVSYSEFIEEITPKIYG